MSHLLCYKKIISENLDFGLIFEDDIMFKIKDIHKLVEQIVPITLPGNITLLYYQSWDKISFHKSKGKELSEKISAYQADDAYDLICAAGYLISKESCEEMIRILLPVHTGPDCWQYVFRKGAFKKLFLLYPIPCGTFNFRSTVTNLEMLDKGSLKSKIIAAIDDYKIPILYQYLKNRRKKNKNNLQQIEVVDD